MLAILKQHGLYNPVIACDACGEVIDDALQALELSSHASEGATTPPFHVHKGRCEQVLSDRIAGLAGSEELAVRLVQLLKASLRASDPALVKNLLQELDADA